MMFGHRHVEVSIDASRMRGRGYLLLEVVFALGLLVLGLSTIGMQIQTSYDTAVDSHRMLRAMQLAESKISELEAGLISDMQEAVENDLEDEFGRLFPDFGWRLRLEPLRDFPEMWMVRLDILYQRRLDLEDEFEFDDSEILFTTRTLRAVPATIDPRRDFGADEESFANLSDALAGTDIDPEAIDLRAIGSLPLDQLMDLLTAFREAGLLEGLDLGSMLPPDVMQMLQEAGLDDVTSDGAGDQG